jgi:serine protease Do
MKLCRLLLVMIAVLLARHQALAFDEKDNEKPQAAKKSVEEIAEAARKSVVVITFTGRDGKEQGLGTGFVVAPDGLIATNLHVLGEGRAISVQFPDGKRHDVTEIHASDRALDLALVRITAKDLTPLPLAESTSLKPGQAIVALGHPRGLEYSVVSGVLSGTRKLDKLSMLQLAIPIEQGNSGGPILDLSGRVVGIVTMKSLVTANLGFGVPSSALKPLLAKPNPIPMVKWLTIGALDPAEWKTAYGGRWRQRSGRIIADGAGTGFGGRTLCFWQRPAPKQPFEVAVSVKLDDEAGAAGLIFATEGGDVHYGFYPSGGKLRLTRFNGPDVFSWKIVKDFPSSHYRPSEWNRLKVRIDKDKIVGYVNDEQVLDIEADNLEGGVGLAKFRETVAEFKHFQVADKLRSVRIADDVVGRITKELAKIPLAKQVQPEQLKPLLPDAAASVRVIRDRARQLEKEAEQLRQLAQEVHHQRVLGELAAAFKKKEEEIDLLQATLLVARLDNEELDEEAYRKEVDRLAREIERGLPKQADAKTRLAALSKFLFQERGFHGSRVDYYTRANSYLNEVIDDREGLPITLSILYMELARRLGLNVVGVPLPGHFVVRHEPAKGTAQLIDVYDGGKELSDKDAAAIVRKFTGEDLKEEQLNAASKKAIVLRVLHNLLNVAQQERDRPGMLRYLDAILTVAPESAEERWVRAVFRFQAGLSQGCLADCDWLLNNGPPDIDVARVRELRRLAAERESR